MSSRHLQKHIIMFLKTVGKFLGNLLFVMGEKSGKKTKGNYWENYSQFFPPIFTALCHKYGRPYMVLGFTTSYEQHNCINKFIQTWHAMNAV